MRHEEPTIPGVGSNDLFSAASNAIRAWDQLTDTTHPSAFQGMKEAMEKLRDAAEIHEVGVNTAEIRKKIEACL